MRLSLILLFVLVAKISLAQITYAKPRALKDFDLIGPVKEVKYFKCEDENNDSSQQMNIMSSRGECNSVLQFNKFGYLTIEILSPGFGIYLDSTVYKFIGDTLLESLCLFRRSGIKKSLFVYNNTSRLVEIEIYQNNGLSRQITFSYDEVTRTLTSSELSYRNGEPIVWEKTFEEFDANGNLICLKKLGIKDVPFEITTFEYDNKNRIISSSIWKLPSKKQGKHYGSPKYYWTTYNYDFSGNLIEISYFVDRNKKPLTSVKYIYDESNLLLEQKDTNYISHYSHSITYEYDSINRKKLVESFIKKNMIGYTTYAYDQSGNLTLEYQTYSYDEKGNLTFEVINDYKANESHKFVWKETARNQYEYDHHNNWIKKYYLDDDGSEKVVTREITYYE